MKTRICLIALVALMAEGCCPTRIVTVSPNVSSRTTYSTTVMIPRTRTVTTTTHVYAADNDICLSLDLQAVGAAFAQSNTVEEFEMLLNNSSYMLSNLDLNNDGYVDYLRVLESIEGRNHVFLIQAVLAYNVYQDVATVVAEMYGYNNAYVQIIGAPYIYGPKYIVQPVFYTTPLIYAHLVRPSYRPWHSPWYWGHFPPHYKRPAPIHLGHYQSYINTYMRNHKYCHKVEYAPNYHYPDYDKVTKASQRNDYGQQHPERSFTVRTATTPSDNGRNSGAANAIVNARDIRERQAASSVTTTTPKTTSRTASGSFESSSSRSAGTTSQPSSSARSTTQKSRTVTTPQTTVRSRVNASGTSSTRTSTVSSDGARSTVKRGAETPAKSASPSATGRSSSAASSSRSTSTSRSSSTTRR